jgi:hypothetical protein
MEGHYFCAETFTVKDFIEAGCYLITPQVNPTLRIFFPEYGNFSHSFYG